ncbi:hypothetical protein [Pseudomarimonas salicorniae]|uniref:Right handed beta helix region n=1 Tax=Pseudomarimonas salicorniae TaxID=2933270 RepID=A0ABT0GJR6_9GAMM|nr:hypothetical protein [Lysobacter sp. CAU 1642]MCK7594773.1 hypothetical protein [Lysobacter sp. CAU 1642]
MRSILMLATLLAAQGVMADTVTIGNRDSAGLIRALQQAAQSAGPHYIRLHPGGLYTLDLTDSEGLALPAIRSQVVIEGRGAEIRGWSHRPMHFFHVSAGGEGIIRDLTLAEANQGAIRNHGRMHLERVTISDSLARGEHPIIANHGSLSLEDSRIEYNVVHAPEGTAALLNNEGTLEVERTSLTGNRITRTQTRPLSAAAFVNRGQIHAEGVSLADNLFNDLLPDSAELQSVLNLSGGRISGSALSAR